MSEKLEQEQLKRWNADFAKDYSEDQFNYDVANLNVHVVNSSQIENRAKKAIKNNPNNRKIHSKMTRIMHEAQHNPYMYRVANVWDKRGTRREHSTKTKSIWNESHVIRRAGQAQYLKQFADKFNQIAPDEQIITAKHDGVKITDGGNKIGEATYNRYPKVDSPIYKNEMKADKYNDGLTSTIHYVTGNYPTKARPLVKKFKHQLKHLDNSLEYSRDYRRMKSAHSLAKRRNISTRKAFAEKYGVGNDRIDVSPDTPIVFPMEDGLKKYRQTRVFMHKMIVNYVNNLSQKMLKKPKQFQTTKHNINHHTKKLDKKSYQKPKTQNKSRKRNQGFSIN